MKMNNRTTEKLMAVLKRIKVEDTDKFFEDNKDNFIFENKIVFRDYMRKVIREKHKTQQEVFLSAGIPNRYGYKLISGERHTLQRDVVIRMCIGAGLNLQETQKALELYQMPKLYPKFLRDAVIMIAINNRVKSVSDINCLLEKHGVDLLVECGKEI